MTSVQRFLPLVNRMLQSKWGSWLDQNAFSQAPYNHDEGQSPFTQVYDSIADASAIRNFWDKEIAA